MLAFSGDRRPTPTACGHPLPMTTKEPTMPQDRYDVRFAGPDTTITSVPDGPWCRWEMARAAAIEHLREHVRECERTLMCLRRAGSFGEYLWLREEIAGSEAQVVEGSTLN
jgi:hypothetical protein